MDLQLQKGAVVVVDLGTIRDVQGHEQALKRPCLVIKTINTLKLATILPLSTKKPPAAVPSFSLTKGVANLNTRSFVLIHQIRTISNRRILHGIGQLPPVPFKKIKQVLQGFLEL